MSLRTTSAASSFTASWVSPSTPVSPEPSTTEATSSTSSPCTGRWFPTDQARRTRRTGGVVFVPPLPHIPQTLWTIGSERFPRRYLPCQRLRLFLSSHVRKSLGKYVRLRCNGIRLGTEHCSCTHQSRRKSGHRRGRRCRLRL